jgi:hypothetical protein
LINGHAPILAVLHSTLKKPTYHFKLENWWLQEEDFQETAMKAWRNSESQAFHTRTTHLAGALKVWRKNRRPLKNQLREIEQRIIEIQEMPIQGQDHNEEHKLIDYE